MNVLSLSVIAVIGLFISVNAFQPTQEWKDFKRLHGKQYETQTEEESRFKIFLDNKVKVEEHNKLAEQGKTTFQMTLNEYADQTHKEFLANMKLDSPVTRTRSIEHTVLKRLSTMDDIPDAVDWRDSGCVQPASDTKGLPCAWPFVSAGAMEGQWCVRHHVFNKLSEQNLLDCAANCSDGTPDDAYTYCVNNAGVDTSDSYPFTGGLSDTCNYKPSEKGVLCNGVVDIPTRNETALNKAVGEDGPVSVYIDASQASFQLYTSGVYIDDACSAEELNLYLLVVGYNATEDGQEYWTARNHWGPSWGENGFVRLARNRDNMCGIATAASYPRTAFCSLTDSGLKCE